MNTYLATHNDLTAGNGDSCVSLPWRRPRKITAHLLAIILALIRSQGSIYHPAAQKTTTLGPHYRYNRDVAVSSLMVRIIYAAATAKELSLTYVCLDKM